MEKSAGEVLVPSPWTQEKLERPGIIDYMKYHCKNSQNNEICAMGRYRGM